MKKLINKKTGEVFEYNPSDWKDDLRITFYTVDDNFIILYTDCIGNPKDSCHWVKGRSFLTKQECEKYIDYNKPQFSKRDMIHFVGDKFYHKGGGFPFPDPDFFTKKLNEYINEKSI